MDQQRPSSVVFVLLRSESFLSREEVCELVLGLESTALPFLWSLHSPPCSLEHHQYELFVTTYAGLNRYRVGDVLRVTGFYNTAPQFHFVCRQNVVLSIDSNKTDEAELHSAVENFVKHLEPFNAHLIEYTSCADTSTIPGHYVLYWELRFDTKTVAVPSSVFEDCCLTVEESLNSVYHQGRAADNSIAPLEIRVVEEGTFDQLMDYALSRGAFINQYKAPWCVKFTLLNSWVIHSYFSPRPPQWAPGCRKWA